MKTYQSGQIIAGPSHEFSPQIVVKSKGIPRLFQGNLGVVKYYTLARSTDLATCNRKKGGDSKWAFVGTSEKMKPTPKKDGINLKETVLLF